MNAMTEAMTEALRKANLPVPSKSERVWRFINDHPGLVATQIAQRLGMQRTTVSSLLSDLVQRGMLITGTTEKKLRLGRGFGSRTLLTFSVHPRMGGQYEILPMPKKLPSAPTPTTPTPTPTPTTPTTTTAAPDIEHLTLAQARELYTVLHQLFGARS